MEKTDTRLPKRLLDICLLAMIEEGDCYGYEMIGALRERRFPLSSERSVYPLLKQLEHQELIESYLQSSAQGPARKYYRIAAKGKRALRQRAEHSFRMFEKARQIVTERVDIDGDGPSS